MMSATALAIVFGATVASRLPPGPATLAAAHWTLTGRRRSAVELLVGLTLVDAAVFLVLVRLELPWRMLIGSAVARAVGVAVLLVVAAVVALGREADATDQPPSRRQWSATPFAAGVAIGLSQPGRWIWWATVGVAITSVTRPYGAGGVLLGLAAFLLALGTLYAAILWLASHRRLRLGPRTRRWMRWVAAAVIAAWAAALAII